MKRFIDFWHKNADRFDALFMDIDGTLISGRNALPGAAELLTELRESGKPFLLLTNDSNHSLEEKSAIIRRIGLDVSPAEIISPGSVLKPWVEEHGETGNLYYIMGGLGNPCFARAAGLRTTTDAEELDNCAGVLVGENRYDWQFVFYAVFNFFLRHPERRLISPSPDICWAGWRKGGFGIGAGGVAEALKLWLKAQDVEIPVIYFGKPYPTLFEYGLKHVKVSIPERVLMLGDSLRGDITGANNAGLKSGLMLTGISTIESAAKASAAASPDYIFDTL